MLVEAVANSFCKSFRRRTPGRFCNRDGAGCGACLSLKDLIMSQAITFDAIAQTYQRIRPYVRRTPLIEIDAGELGLSPGRLALKLEFMQHSGSLKARGAFASLLSEAVPPAGIAAASGGILSNT